MTRPRAGCGGRYDNCCRARRDSWRRRGRHPSGRRPRRSSIVAMNFRASPAQPMASSALRSVKKRSAAVKPRSSPAICLLHLRRLRCGEARAKRAVVLVDRDHRVAQRDLGRRERRRQPLTDVDQRGRDHARGEHGRAALIPRGDVCRQIERVAVPRALRDLCRIETEDLASTVSAAFGSIAAVRYGAMTSTSEPGAAVAP